MSITLNHSDFQCLQDQIVELKTKNYELAEKNRRSQADFETAKAKICSLQLKLEEQERDFQVTSTTLRREIEAAYNSNSNNSESNKDDNDGNKHEDYKAKYKKLLHKAKELQQRYEKSVEVVQQMDIQINVLTAKAHKLDEENSRLKLELQEKQKQLDMIEEDHRNKLESAINEYKTTAQSDCQEHVKNLNAITLERDNLKLQVDKLKDEVNKFDLKLENQAEERKIQERKGLQIVKELKRQLALEKNRSETLQKRLENLLSETSTTSALVSNSDLESRSHISTSSSTNGNSNSSNGNSNRANNQDANSVSSWSLVPGKTKSSNPALYETLSICSIESEDRETVQQPCDTRSECSLQPVSSSSPSTSRHELSASTSLNSPMKLVNTPSHVSHESVRRGSSSIYHGESISTGGSLGMLVEEQAALMERLTRLQHDKWTLEEKLSYMEQANVALTEDLTNKSDIIKHYFMDQALRTNSNLSHHDATSGFHGLSTGNNLSRRTSLSNNVNQLLSDKLSLKKVVDFLKERSQISSTESENISREATRKMQLMLEETLIKCLKLQENLDLVTSELNKLQR